MYFISTISSTLASSSKNDVIIHSLSCHSKPVCHSFFSKNTNEDILEKNIKVLVSITPSVHQLLSCLLPGGPYFFPSPLTSEEVVSVQTACSWNIVSCTWEAVTEEVHIKSSTRVKLSVQTDLVHSRPELGSALNLTISECVSPTFRKSV